MTNQLTVIDAYLQNEAIHQKIEKAVIKKNKFEQLKAQRDSIIHFNATTTVNLKLLKKYFEIIQLQNIFQGFI